MIGIVLVTHASIGAELLKAAEMILGPQPACLALSVDISQGMQEMLEEIRKAAAATDQGQGVAILTDMFGGTPSNLSLSLLSNKMIEVVTGVNLPMLLKLLGQRTQPLDKAMAEAKTAAKQGIIVASEILKRKVSEGKDVGPGR